MDIYTCYRSCTAFDLMTIHVQLHRERKLQAVSNRDKKSDGRNSYICWSTAASQDYEPTHQDLPKALTNKVYGPGSDTHT